MKTTLVLTVLSLAILLGNIGTKSAHAQSLRTDQVKVLKHNMLVSLHTKQWYHGPGHWTLHERFKTCKAVSRRYSEKRAGICYKARLTLERHTERYNRINAILYPKPVYSGGGYNWSSMVWNCEAKGVPDPWYANTGNGFYFGPQFTISTWHANGGGPVREMGDRGGVPMHSYSVDFIEHVAYNVMTSQGPGAWPHCNGYL